MKIEKAKLQPHCGSCKYADFYDFEERYCWHIKNKLEDGRDQFVEYDDVCEFYEGEE